MSEATIPELHRPPAINTDPDDTVSPLGAHNRSESAPPGLAPLQRQSSSRRFPLASPSARQARVNIASNLFPHGAWGSLSGSQAHVQPNDTVAARPAPCSCTSYKHGFPALQSCDASVYGQPTAVV
eukprot:2407577-Rhodomonas_salina.2